MSTLHIALSTTVFGVYCALLTAAAVCDAWKFIIPNQVSLGISGLFLASAPFWPVPVPWLSHIGAGTAVLAVGMVLFSLGRIGGGDVKLISAISLWTGFEHLLEFLILVSLAGGVLALLLVLVRRTLKWRRSVRADPAPPALPRLWSVGESIPYAVAIAPAGIFVGSRLPAAGWPWL
jgi:prepilin peptidase CpaA